MYTPHGNPLKRVGDKRREREREIFNEVETTYTVPLLGSFFKKGTRPTPPCLEFHPPDLFHADKVDRSRQCLRLYARPRNESLVSNAIFPTFHSVHVYIYVCVLLIASLGVSSIFVIVYRDSLITLKNENATCCFSFTYVLCFARRDIGNF